MCETSNKPTEFLTVLCSSIIEVYCTGICQPAKSTILANNTTQDPSASSPVNEYDRDVNFAETDLNRKIDAWENGGREKLAQWRKEHEKDQTEKKQNVRNSSFHCPKRKFFTFFN